MASSKVMEVHSTSKSETVRNVNYFQKYGSFISVLFREGYYLILSLIAIQLHLTTRKDKYAANFLKISLLNIFIIFKVMNKNPFFGVERDTLQFWLNKWIEILVSCTKITYCSVLYHPIKLVRGVLNLPA